MWQLLERDIVCDPDLSPVKGQLALPEKPGLGFELDHAAVGEAAEQYRRLKSGTESTSA